MAVAQPRPSKRVTKRGHLRVIPGGLSGAPAIRVRRNKRKQAQARPGPLFAATAFLLIAGAIFGLVFLNIAAAQKSFELAEIRSEAGQLETRYHQLRLEVARAEAPARVEKAAKELGLVVPDEQRYLLGPAEAGDQAAGDLAVGHLKGAGPGP